MGFAVETLLWGFRLPFLLMVADLAAHPLLATFPSRPHLSAIYSLFLTVLYKLHSKLGLRMYFWENIKEDIIIIQILLLRTLKLREFHDVMHVHISRDWWNQEPNPDLSDHKGKIKKQWEFYNVQIIQIHNMWRKTADPLSEHN